jgi:hypothetical protein
MVNVLVVVLGFSCWNGRGGGRVVEWQLALIGTELVRPTRKGATHMTFVRGDQGSATQC